MAPRQVRGLAIWFGSAGSGVVAANKTTTDADKNGFDSSEGDANPFPSAGMTTPNPVDPLVFTHHPPFCKS
jgi:hypothetical protein